MTQQTIILQSQDVLVIERDGPTSIVTTEVETILLVEDTEIVILEVAEQGPTGPTLLISADLNNRTTQGLDGGIFTPEIVVDPLAYYILAKA